MKCLRLIGDDRVAEQICGLVNTYNGWYRSFSPEEILNGEGIYIIESIGDTVLGCIGIVPFYIFAETTALSEIRHLCVHPVVRNMGFGERLIQRAFECMPTQKSIVFIKEKIVCTYLSYCSLYLSIQKK